MLEINQVYQGDCLQVMKKIEDKSIDYCIADFPYNISNYGNSITKKGNNFVKGDFGCWDKWDDMEEYLKWVFIVSKEVQRILKPLASCLFFFDNRQAGWISYELEREGVFVYKSPIIWVKNNPIPHLRKTGFRSSFEHGTWLINSQERYIGNANIVIKPKTFNFQEQAEMMNVMKYNIGQKETEHETEKPLELISRFINIFTIKNELVLDLFSGSGNCSIAAKNLGRNFIGIEKEPKYVEISRQRLRQGILL
jgi:DNA modification methylase